MVKRENTLIAKEKAAASGVNLSHTSGIALQQGDLISTIKSQLLSLRSQTLYRVFFLKSIKLHVYAYNMP